MICALMRISEISGISVFAQLNMNDIDDVVCFALLSKLVFQIHKEIFKTVAQKKMNGTVGKITKEESIQIDSVYDWN